MHAYVNVAQVWGLSLVTVVLGVAAYAVVKEAQATHTEPWRVLSTKFNQVFR